MMETEICRACCNQSDSLKSLYQSEVFNEDKELTLGEVLSYCTNIEFTPIEDKKHILPGYVCASCEEIIIAIFNFRQLVLRSDQILRSGLVMYDVELCKDSNDEETVESVNIYVSENSTDSCQSNASTILHEDSAKNSPSVTQSTNLRNKTHTNDTKSYKTEVECKSCQSVYDNYDLYNEHVTKCIGLTAINENNDENQKASIHNLNKLSNCQKLNNNNVFECCKCSEVFTSAMNLRKHILIHCDMMTYFCHICKKSYKSIRTLRTHMYSHTEEKPFQCDICGKVLTQKHILVTHMLTHTGEKPHHCNFCGQQFRDKRTLLVHKRGKHSNIRPYKCSNCKKSFATSTQLKVHAKIHFDGLLFSCALCDKSYRQSRSLRLHMLGHAGERPVQPKNFTCNICGKNYQQLFSLQTHMKTHTGEKPFKCETCGKSMIRKSDYKKHILSHSNNKPHVCDICGKSFRYSSNLNVHKQYHKAKKYKCEYCEISYYTTHSLKRHIRSRHAEQTDNENKLTLSNEEERTNLNCNLVQIY
ncbi:zinc finger protein OZF-like [Teleopsis dalmanni]|uniref:zinc finger protein OZF-like n=1 Tax=Teleopsis dalmanni TaxID=139649 RepID=UPI0018CF82C5|nr:zinc finger protein OZF-like [Teleopsis dalmanni]